MIAINEDLQAIQDQAARFLSERADPEYLKTLLDRPASFDAENWQRVAELGWPMLAVDDSQGGLGLGLRGLAVLAQEMGRTTISLPLLPVYQLAQIIRHAAAVNGGESAVAEVLEQLMAGSSICCFVNDSSLALVQGKLQGRTPVTAFAAVADYAIVLASTAEQQELLLVALNDPAVAREETAAIDQARAQARLAFSAAPVIVLATDNAAGLYDDCLASAALVTAFEQSSGAEAAMLLARDYALERKVFGQTLGALQAIKHKIADMYWRIELARGCADDALLAFEAGDDSWRELAAASRVAAIEAYEFSARECMQTFGGLGSTWEGLPQHHYRRSRVLALELGSRLQWRENFYRYRQSGQDQAREPLEALPELRAYRQRARAWLAENAPAYSGAVRRGLSFAEDLALGRKWQAKKAEGGFACINLPAEYGGAGLTELHKIVFGEEELKYQLPTEYFVISTAQLMAIFLRYAPEAARRELAPKAIRGEQIWCQMFSEPGAGSDLAAVRLKAERHVRDGVEGWLLNGQKLWTSWAQVADWGFIVARSNSDGPKHAGITCFYADMHSQGISVRPIRRMAGHDDVNEVFFDNVFIPDSQRLGDEGRGFAVAMEMLMIERVAGVYDESIGGVSLDTLFKHAEESEVAGAAAIADGEIRATLLEAYIERQGLRSIYRRGMAAVGNGKEPGPEASIRKLIMGRARQRLGALALDLMGPDGVEMDPQGDFRTDFAWSWIDPAGRIAGGTDEVLLNTIAERVLGLPQDHRPDKNKPFKELN
ncbi:MAG: acyl-CoA dehydrogenase [Gammaproteobacteria bacterium]|uniref:acyl-CoA dehydrogenase family protein n=1 Tax=Pseudomaricurvus alcaniphilus TaxID=1166482 RepID=UPI00140E8B99|nr:acyl-CoA dehydrogenase [Gammaproteobacteria bacterium]NHN37284.1 acyl-CoA dehydrogenase [Pseudomaricurvus alcaniphilus]